MESSKILVVFDLDGTLNQTDLYALKAYHKTFDELGIGPFQDHEIISRFGAPFQEDVQFFFHQPSPSLIERYQSLLEKYWNRYLNAYGKPYPNVTKTLTQLQKEGYLLCVCSNAPLEEITNTLRILKIDRFFHSIKGLEGSSSKSDSLSQLIQQYQPEKTFMIGDRYYDLKAAKHNGVACIGCAYGFGKDEIQNADFVIHNILEVCDIIKAI